MSRKVIIQDILESIHQIVITVKETEQIKQELSHAFRMFKESMSNQEEWINLLEGFVEMEKYGKISKEQKRLILTHLGKLMKDQISFCEACDYILRSNDS